VSVVSIYHVNIKVRIKMIKILQIFHKDFIKNLTQVVSVESLKKNNSTSKSPRVIFLRGKRIYMV
jgi:hypothetical protein